MVQASGFFRENFSATLLRSAALALLVLASPARSETIDLTCTSTGAGPSFLFPGANVRLLIDTGGSTVTEIRNEGGSGAFKSDPLAAKVSDQFIEYSGPLPGNSDYWLMGTLDRIVGTLRRTIRYPRGGVESDNYACRRATQKF